MCAIYYKLVGKFWRALRCSVRYLLPLPGLLWILTFDEQYLLIAYRNYPIRIFEYFSPLIVLYYAIRYKLAVYMGTGAN